VNTGDEHWSAVATHERWLQGEGDELFLNHNNILGIANMGYTDGHAEASEYTRQGENINLLL
jgi:prepilin-type processing-associated H-X9-DG protein